jgi:hypothetical protein
MILIIFNINVIDRNDTNCKDIENFTHPFGSKGAPSRGTMFIEGQAHNNNNNNNNNNNLQNLLQFPVL